MSTCTNKNIKSVWIYYIFLQCALLTLFFILFYSFVVYRLPPKIFGWFVVWNCSFNNWVFVCLPPWWTDDLSRCFFPASRLQPERVGGILVTLVTLMRGNWCWKWMNCFPFSSKVVELCPLVAVARLHMSDPHFQW